MPGNVFKCFLNATTPREIRFCQQYMAKSQNLPPSPGPPKSVLLAAFIYFKRGLTIFRGPVVFSLFFLCCCLFFLGSYFSVVLAVLIFGHMIFLWFDGIPCLLMFPLCGEWVVGGGTKDGPSAEKKAAQSGATVEFAGKKQSFDDSEDE